MSKKRTPTDERLERFVDLVTGNADIDIGVDKAFVVSVNLLKKALRVISSHDNGKWWVEKERDKSILVSYRGPNEEGTSNGTDASVSFLKFSDGGVCLYIPWKQGIDCAPEKFEEFWRPLQEQIALEYARQQTKLRNQLLIHRAAERKQPLTTLDHCIRTDEEQLTNEVQSVMISEFLARDSAFYTPHRVLANEDGAIRDGRSFAGAFRDLIKKGCKPQALAESVGNFLSYQWSRGTEEGRDWSRFPGGNELVKLSDKLLELAGEVWELESNYHISTALVDFDRLTKIRRYDAAKLGQRPVDVTSLEIDEIFELEAQFEAMAASMETYAQLLKLWKPPRSDSIRVYGLIAPLVYTQIGTGEPQYGLVSTLFQACMGDKDRDEYTDTSLLKKRSKYFQDNFPVAFRKLKSSLEDAHNYTGPCYPPVDFESVLTKLEKSR